ncbi:hypothetical protein [Sporosalibacterium faouarense]|uniref:hypothetical protein n=1 Tax=Sporosalibacterium faouarense TaxID=516123 RepID=UPI00192A9524|nr:hypothetical protein [Sporosalibacterium faouarense]
MEGKELNLKNFTTVILIIIISILVFWTFNLSNQLQQVKHRVSQLTFDVSNLTEQIDVLKNKYEIIADTNYSVSKIKENDEILAKTDIEITSNKLQDYRELKLLYRKAFDSTKGENYDYSKEKWNSVKLVDNTGIFKSELVVPFSSNYELKVSFMDDNKIRYEEIPSLDLYSKSEATFMKDINIYKVNNDKLEFDAQIAKFRFIDDTKLIKAICNVYYDNKEIKSIDIIEANQEDNRKAPRKQLEHDGQDYWFIIEEVDLSKINKLDKSKITIEIVLEDSLDNTYKRIERVE